MPLRSASRTTTATSGPGRGPASDVRTRHRRRSHPGAPRRRREASAETLRLRAETLFAPEQDRTRGELRHGPPVEWGEGDAQGCEELREEPATAGGRLRTPAGSGRSPGVGAGAGAESGARAAGAFEAADEDADEGVGEGVGEAVDEVGEEVRGAPAWRVRAGLAVRERMPLWLQSRCGLERRSVAALAVVLVVAAALAVQHFWAGRTQPVRAPEIVRAAVPYGAEANAAGQKAAAGTSAAAAAAGDAAGAPAGAVPTALVVDVSGKVREPGVHRLPAGSRVADALKAAGGVRPGTDIGGLNRARFLVDGEQVVVGAPSAAGSGAAGVPGVPGPGVAGGSGVAGPGGAAPAPVTPIALNTATLEQLDTLPGVGPVLAQHIIDHRGRHGGFRSVDELREVNGIGDRRFADLRNLVRP
ncbi:helix-hairpin-helix domain-containing protein [Streptomyces sp. FR-108]|uniref:helix-hairpin-helix domain-containing protein n=1 Tax=Streptomyces sp. FR-108 TaxID=3416665 RepID=UPI003CF47F83